MTHPLTSAKPAKASEVIRETGEWHAFPNKYGDYHIGFTPPGGGMGIGALSVNVEGLREAGGSYEQISGLGRLVGCLPTFYKALCGLPLLPEKEGPNMRYEDGMVIIAMRFSPAEVEAINKAVNLIKKMEE